MPAAKFVLLTTVGLIPANLVTAFVGTSVGGDIPLKYWIGGWGIVIAVWLIVRRIRRPKSFTTESTEHTEATR